MTATITNHVREILVLNATKEQLVLRARDVLLDAMNSPLDEWSDGDQFRIAVAQWVLEHTYIADSV